MKRKLLLIALVCLSAICASAQQSAPSVTPTPDDLQGWKEYSYKEDNIRFRLAEEPEVTTNKAKNERSYRLGAYELTVSPAGIDIGRDRESQKRYLILLSMSLDQIIESSRSTLIKRENVTVDGVPALFVHYRSSGGTVIRAKMFVIGNKVYAAQVESKRNDQRKAAQENDLERSALAFLDSIHLISK